MKTLTSRGPGAPSVRPERIVLVTNPGHEVLLIGGAVPVARGSEPPTRRWGFPTFNNETPDSEVLGTIRDQIGVGDLALRLADVQTADPEVTHMDYVGTGYDISPANDAPYTWMPSGRVAELVGQELADQVMQAVGAQALSA